MVFKDVLGTAEWVKLCEDGTKTSYMNNCAVKCESIGYCCALCLSSFIGWCRTLELLKTKSSGIQGLCHVKFNQPIIRKRGLYFNFNTLSVWRDDVNIIEEAQIFNVKAISVRREVVNIRNEAQNIGPRYRFLLQSSVLVRRYQIRYGCWSTEGTYYVVRTRS
jgi:hypothetical protein